MLRHRGVCGQRNRRTVLIRHSGLLIAVALYTASPVAAATFTVTTTADSGAGSLRQAIADADATPDHDTVVFAIPAGECSAAGVCVIQLASTIELFSPVTIDGTTQPRYGTAPANTCATATDPSYLRVQLEAATGVRMLDVNSPTPSTVRGLALGGGYGVALGGGGGPLVRCNHFCVNGEGDAGLTGRGTVRDTGFWARQGVRAADGAALPRLSRASILLPAGAEGPALMIFDNYAAIQSYNSAMSYVIGVGHLSDRLRGSGGFAADWPRGDRMLARTEKVELQERLTARGFDTNGIDGKIGPDTAAAIQRYQAAAGLRADGYATPALLAGLR